jgi:hypothetical protein
VLNSIDKPACRWKEVGSQDQKEVDEKNSTRVVFDVKRRFAFVIKTARDDSCGVSLGCE